MRPELIWRRTLLAIARSTSRRRRGRRPGASSVCLLLVVAVLGLASAGAAATLGPAPARLVGTYRATLGNYPALGFYKGRYTLYIRPGNRIAFTILDATTFPNSASYSGNRMVLAAEGQCTAAGTYTWALDGTKLDLRKIRDPCTPRAVLLSRIWTKAT